MLLCERALKARSASSASPEGVPPLPYAQPQLAHGPPPHPMAPRPAVSGVPDYVLRSLERAVAVYFPRRSTAATAASLAVTASGVSAQAQPPFIRRRSTAQVSAPGYLCISDPPRSI